MNFSRLIKAMAVVGLVGFGSYAMGTTLGEDDFESYNTNATFQAQATTPWTVSLTDETGVMTSLVTELGELPDCVTNYYGETYETIPVTNNVLVLNTGTNELKYAVVSTEQYDVYVDSLVQLIASDTPPVLGTDATNIQTAVYLNSTDNRLYGWCTDTNAAPATNKWIQLADVAVTNTQWVCLQISLDYVTGYFDTEAYATVKVDGVVAGSYVVANAAKGRLAISEVAFRGTGMVDNFSVGQTENGLSLATLVKQCVDASGNVIDAALGDTGVEYEINVDTFTEAFWLDLANATPAYPAYELDRVEVVGPGFTNVVTGTDLDGEKTITFDVNDVAPPAAFEDDGTYYVRGVYTIKQYTVTVDYQGTNAPDDPTPQVLDYGENFVWDLNGIVATNDVAITVTPASGYGYGSGEISYGDPELPVGSTVLTLAYVTNNLAVTITGTFASTGPDIDIVPTVENPLEWTMIATGDPMTFSFTSGGTTNNPVMPVLMTVLVSETVNGPTNAMYGAVVSAGETAGVLTGTVTITNDLSAFDTLFFRGFRYE